MQCDILKVKAERVVLEPTDVQITVQQVENAREALMHLVATAKSPDAYPHEESTIETPEPDQDSQQDDQRKNPQAVRKLAPRKNPPKES